MPTRLTRTLIVFSGLPFSSLLGLVALISSASGQDRYAAPPAAGDRYPDQTYPAQRDPAAGDRYPAAGQGAPAGQAVPAGQQTPVYRQPADPRAADPRAADPRNIDPRTVTPVSQAQVAHDKLLGPAPVPKAPFQLTQPEADWVVQVMNYWETRSNKVNTYTCKFQRWEYDPDFGPKEWWKDAKTISKGEIRYGKPDKGLLRVDVVDQWKPAKVEGGPVTYEKRVGLPGEHWVCNGKSLFQFDYLNKKLIEAELPPDMKGEAISEGPLPFLFNAKAGKLMDRYWFKPITPREVKDEYWIDAWPKRQIDAANYQHVEIILDKEFLPIALQIYSPNGKSRTVYQFAERKVNPFNLLDMVAGDFSTPSTPFGWKRVVERYEAVSASGPRTSNVPKSQQPPR